MEVYFANVVLLHVLLRLFFPWPYNGRNLDLFSPGCYNEGTKLHFACFFPWQGHFLQQMAKIGFHSTESNGSFFSSSPGGVSTPLTAQTDPWSSSSDFPTPFVGKMPKNGHKREESYEGHLGFKMEVSLLIFPSGEEERKKKTLNKLCGTQSYCKVKSWKKSKKKSFY